MNTKNLYTNRSIVVFDVETTGKDPDVDRIVQFAGVKLDGDLTEVDRMVLSIDPDFPIDPEASKVHGITNEDLKGGPKFAEVGIKIYDFIGDSDLAGHNVIAFDLPLLMAEFARHLPTCQIKLEGRRLLDTLQLFRHFMPHTLEHAVLHYCGEKLEGAHDALVDTAATAKLLKAQMSTHSINTDRAHELSMGTRVTMDGKLVRNEDGEIAISFGKQKGRTLKELAKMDAGFLRWILKKDFSAETKSYVQKALRGTL